MRRPVFGNPAGSAAHYRSRPWDRCIRATLLL